MRQWEHVIMNQASKFSVLVRVRIVDPLRVTTPVGSSQTLVHRFGTAEFSGSVVRCKPVHSHGSDWSLFIHFDTRRGSTVASNSEAEVIPYACRSNT